MSVGIYGIHNKVTGMVYVGKSSKVENRLARHKTELKYDKHFNKWLQNSYNKHGIDNFEFNVIELCDVRQLPVKEQYWIDQISPNIYNVDLHVEDQKAGHNSFFGRQHTTESKKKISETHKGKKLGVDNPNYGKKQPLATRLKMSQNNSQTKLNADKVGQIVTLLRENVPHQKIADMFNISRTVVTRISNGTRWANVTGGPVFPVEYVDNQRVFRENHKAGIVNGRRGKKHTEAAKKKISESRKRRYT